MTDKEVHVRARKVTLTPAETAILRERRSICRKIDSLLGNLADRMYARNDALVDLAKWICARPYRKRG